MMKMVLMAVALICSGCACNLNWQRYRAVPGAANSESALIQEDFVVRAIGTDHSRSSGFTSDIREPYSIHTILCTRTDVTAYEINRVCLFLDSGTEEILGADDEPIRVPCSENVNGLFIGRYTFQDAFDQIKPSIEISIEGRLIFGEQTDPFSFRRTFKMEKGKQRWISFSEMMSI